MHKKGEEKKEIVANKKAKTISILIKGKFLIRFPEDNKDVLLSEIGEYVFWDSMVYHNSEALEDSIVMTIRWPSITNDTLTFR